MITEGEESLLATVQFDSARWQAQSEWESALLGPHGLRLPEWIERGQAAVVKRGAHRTVYRVELPPGSFYVKHYHGRSAADRGKHLLRASPARREFNKTKEIARRGLPAARPLAVGEARRGGLIAESYFVSAELQGARPLSEFLFEIVPSLPPREQATIRRALTERLAELCGAMHEAGVWQNDLHLGNILVRDCAATANEPHLRPPRLELFLIDVPGVRFSPPLGWRRSRDSLAMLLAGLRERTTRTERWRFWRRYLEARPRLALPGPLRVALDELDTAAWRHAHRIVASRDKRCVRDNRDFYQLRRPGMTACAVEDLPRELLAKLAADPESPIREARHAPIKISHSSVVVRTELELAGGPVTAAYKRSRVKSPAKRLLAPLRQSRALKGWRLGHALLQRGISTARPLCVIEPSRGRDAWLATEWIEGAQNLHLYLWDLATRSGRERAARAMQCAAALGRLIGRMHGWRISHRDLKACNLVAVERADDVQVSIIDLDGVELRRRSSAANRASDLARLATSMTMHSWLGDSARLRFLKSYLRSLYFGAPSDACELRELWHAVAPLSESKRTQMARAGKRVA